MRYQGDARPDADARAVDSDVALQRVVVDALPVSDAECEAERETAVDAVPVGSVARGDAVGERDARDEALKVGDARAERDSDAETDSLGDPRADLEPLDDGDSVADARGESEPEVEGDVRGDELADADRDGDGLARGEREAERDAADETDGADGSALGVPASVPT